MRVTAQSKPRPAMPSECITVEVIVNELKGIALIDSGSSINAISPAFACVAEIEAFPLEKPIGLQLGCVRSRSKINFGMFQAIKLGSEELNTYLDVVNLDHYDIVLGIPFLKLNNVVLDMSENSIHVGGVMIPTRVGPPKKVNNTMRERNKRRGGPSNE